MGCTKPQFLVNYETIILHVTGTQESQVLYSDVKRKSLDQEDPWPIESVSSPGA